MSGPIDAPWPTDFEVEVRQALHDIRAHQHRQDKLLMQLQIEARESLRKVYSQLRAIATLLGANGAGAESE